MVAGNDAKEIPSLAPDRFEGSMYLYIIFTMNPILSIASISLLLESMRFLEAVFPPPVFVACAENLARL